MGGDARSRYQAMISATTTAAAMMSTLLMSIASLYCSLAFRASGPGQPHDEDGQGGTPKIVPRISIVVANRPVSGRS